MADVQSLASFVGWNEAFPVHVNFESGNFSDSFEEDYNGDLSDRDDVVSYLQTILYFKSGGLGILFGLIVSIAMLIGIVLFWCCPCCGFHTCCLCCRKKVREKEASKCERRTGYVLLFLALLFAGCGVGLLYPSTTAALTDTHDTMTHSADIAVDVMNYVCGDPLVTALVDDGVDFDTYTENTDPSEMCTTSTSLVAYMTDTSCKVNSTVDSVIAYIDGLQDIVDGLQNATNAAGNVVSALESFADTVDDINTTCTTKINDNITATNAAFSTTVVSTCCGSVPQNIETIDSVESFVNQEDVQELNDAIVDAEAARDDLQNATDESRTTIEDELRGETLTELEDAKIATYEVTQNGSSIMLDVVDVVEEVRETILEYQTDYYDEYEQYAIIAFCCLYGVSFVFLLISMCGYTFRKTWIVQCGGCCIFLTLFYLCIILGLSIVFWILIGDTCDNFFTGNAKSNNLGLFQVNLNGQNVSFGENITLVLGDSIVDVLQCQGGCNDIASASCDALPSMNATNTGCDETNNLIDMFKLDEQLNFTDDVQPAIDEMLNASSAFNYTGELQSAIQELQSNSTNGSLTRDYSANSTELYNATNVLRDALPACPDVSGCSSNPSTEECEKWLAVWNFGDGTQAGAGSGGTVCICDNLNDEALYDTVTTFWEANCALHTNVQALNNSLESCESATLSVSDDQDNILSAIDELAQRLDDADVIILSKQDEIVEEANRLMTLVEYIIAEAPGHTTCAIVSNAWNVIVEQDVCTNLHENLQNLIAGMALCVFGMIFGFFVMMDCANPHRMEPERKKRQGGPPSAHSWEHPLQDERGPIDEDGRVRIPETPRRYWNGGDMSSEDSLRLDDSRTKKTGMLGPMYPDNDNMVIASPVASSHPVRERPVNATSVVAVSTEESNLYGL